MNKISRFISVICLIFASVFLFATPVAYAEDTGANIADTVNVDENANSNDTDATGGDPCGPDQWKNGINAIYKYKCLMGNGLSSKDILGKDGVITTGINLLLYIVGAISVVMLIYGGLRYIISGGDKDKVNSAKNTIIYAIIGLVLAVLAYSLVNFVLVTIGGGQGV